MRKYIGETMKALLVMMTIVGSFSLFAYEIKVSKMIKEPLMDRRWNLKSSLETRLVLDCQSFLQGLTLGEKESEEFYMMDSQDCENLAGRMKNSLSKRENHCLDLEDDLRADYSCH